MLEESPPDCIDAQLDACVGKVRVVANQISDNMTAIISQKDPAWVIIGRARCEALAASTEFSDKYAAAEEELKILKTSMKRGEKVLLRENLCADHSRIWKMQMPSSKY